ncbi:helix-turn-helix domain-containing protein [Deinococcus taeanensis]|uniref:MerR family transcriptional regulator n=1 Tax=Deinococcus taeanensis TaxID=2737050 RepID=UPI001CDCABD5|nr:helix-turn-helix domain-containing protein [Deinococcus taeanensis]UBV42966.1 helix-turn-helix domain-containing protein [Deinococcus taeanensis]
MPLDLPPGGSLTLKAPPEVPHDPHPTIGAFAQASRLSPKALRLYDDLGLLRPAQVDPASGYRLYDPAQLHDAQLIGLLRRVDLPLADIRGLLGTPPPARPAALRAHLTRMERQHRQRRDLTRYLIDQMEGAPPLTLPPTRFVPAQAVAALTFHVFVPDLPRTIQTGMQALLDHVRAQGVRLTTPAFVIYHGEVNADSDGPVEICVPYAGPLTPGGNLTLRVEPAHHEAFVTLTRAQFEFPAILAAYDATCAAAAQHGTPGPLHAREVYAYDWAAAGPDDPAGDVAWPFVPHPAAQL